MDNSSLQAMEYSSIRQTIRRVILPLVQAIYDDNPSDIVLYCSDYFDDLLQKRKSVFGTIGTPPENDAMENIERESPELKESPTYIQESLSAPTLGADKQSAILNVRGTSSWDSPSNIKEPIKSLADLKDVVCGIGDQPSLAENDIGLENDAKVGDTLIILKGDNAFKDNSFIDNMSNTKIKNDFTEEYPNKNTEEDINNLCTKFKGLKTLGTLKSDRGIDSDKDIGQEKYAQAFGQLSPNSSFGFIPHLDELDSEEERKNTSSENSDDEDFKVKSKKMSIVATKISETFHDLADKISCSETNLNFKLQNAKEISDAIERENNANAMIFDSKSNQISDGKSDFIEENSKDIITDNSDKYDMNGTKYANDICTGNWEKMEEYAQSNYDFEEQITSQKEILFDKEKNHTVVFENEDIKDKSPSSEPQKVIDNSCRRKHYEDSPFVDNLNCVERGDPRLFQGYFSSRRSSIKGAGDISFANFGNQNETSIDDVNPHSRDQVSTKSPTIMNDSKYSGFFAEMMKNTPRSKVFDKLSERNVSSANPQNIPYSWRKTCKILHLSENLVEHSKGSQIQLSEEQFDSVSEVSSEVNEDKNKEITLAVTDSTHDNLTIQKPIAKLIKQYEDIVKEENLDKIANDDSVKTQQLQRNGLLKNELSTNSKDEGHSEKYFFNGDGFICDPSAIQKDEYSGKGKQNTSEGDKKVETKDHDSRLSLLNAQRGSTVSENNHDSRLSLLNAQRGNTVRENNHDSRLSLLNAQRGSTVRENNHDSRLSLLNAQRGSTVSENNTCSKKDQHELLAGCGDFVSVISDVDEQGIDSQISSSDADKNGENHAEQNNAGSEAISKEYLEEVIERVMEQQQDDSMVSIECLNFSSCSESDSSEREFSEADDFNADRSMQDM